MDTFRVAVIGHTGKGNYGHGLDRVWLSVPGCKLVAVADADPTGRAQAAKRLQVTEAYADYRQMLDQVKPDIVSVAPRWLDQHCDMVLAAAERGVHIYMEKPFCRSLAEADRIVAACEKHHVKLAIAFQTRYSPKLQAVRDLIFDGRIGQLLELRGPRQRRRPRRRRGSVGAGQPYHELDAPVRRGTQLVFCHGAARQTSNYATGRPPRKRRDWAARR